MHALETVARPLVTRQAVLLATLEIQHVVRTEDSTIMLLRLVIVAMLLVRLVMDQQLQIV